ncbi:enoyl-CoA hydratase/isomerase family protein [Pseudomonas sp. v388]|uniref:enoyl-CoA hydratase/isomerase family protein n=1 Tax=Pseudomonas sp. v388 TaxID=2479849 RepID=UPI000F79D447|nr:enoyl-CoA hydratase/isomerase family protein [Pseudomonas sp. v388]RRV10515.1 enoyl-CoA hydratase/isomerase family protein [Pseudomonas sp. v388]
MTSTELLINRQGGRATITISNPSKRNAIATHTASDLVQTLRTLDQEPDIRVIVITGEGECFSSGGDLDEFLATVDSGATRLWETGEPWQELFGLIPKLSKPVIARVVGPAMAGACGLVAACDFAYASDDSSFGSPEIKIGLFPLFILPALVNRMGSRHALDLALTGRTISSSDAVRMGLINAAVEVNQLDDLIASQVNAFIKLEPETVKRGKHAFHKIASAGFEEGLELARGLRPAFMCSEELRRGIEKFFTGKGVKA